MDTTSLATDIIGKFSYIGGVLQREGNRLLKPFGLNQQQFLLLFEIGKTNFVRQKDIIEHLHLEKAHVSKSVKKLEYMGLITVTISSDDRRSAWLSVTDEGTLVLEKAYEQFCKWNKNWFEQFPSEELEELKESLENIEKWMIKKI